MSTKVVEIKTLKVGKYIVLGGEASKITSLTTSSPGKHGAAKARRYWSRLHRSFRKYENYEN